MTYLWILPALVQERFGVPFLHISYYRSELGAWLASEGHLTIPVQSYDDYRNWPGFLFVVAFLILITKVPGHILCEYLPLPTLFFMSLLTFLILRKKLGVKLSLFGALWFLSSFWFGQYYFSPQSMAYMIYLVICLLLVKLLFEKKNHDIGLPLSLMILFGALVFTHVLTAALTIAAFTAIYLSNKFFQKEVGRNLIPGMTLIILFFALFLSYNFFIVFVPFSSLVKIVFEELSQGQTHISSLRGRVIGSTSYLLEIIGTYGITSINVIIVFIASLQELVLHLKKKTEDFPWIAWIAPMAIFGLVTKYGASEALNRGFMFALAPSSYLCIALLKRKPQLLIVMLVLLCLLSIPAQYARSYYLMLTTTELDGTAFYVKHTSQDETYFYGHSRFIIWLHNATNRHKTPLSLGLPPFTQIPSEAQIRQTIEKSRYILNSGMQRNYYQYFIGFDPLESFNLNSSYDRTYDNGAFIIYSNSHSRVD
jgi:hypothetical protein